ncbi:MAG: hypothetical protein J0I41_23810 [Filimonas sp.]|nr:hypothetical protein [Filimonas sp.]
MRSLKNGLLLLITIGVIVASCSLPKKRICKLWTYTYDASGSGTVLFKGKPDSSFIPVPSSFIDIQEDGNYAAYFSSFDNGKWSLINGKELKLVNSAGKEQVFVITKQENDVLGLSPQTGVDYTFSGMDNHFADAGSNPYSKENNLWLVKASHKESDEELKARLCNHLQFWEVYFKWARKQKLTTLTVRGLTTPIKMYGNGFALYAYNELPKTWTSLFYDSEDAEKAYNKLNDLIRSSNLNWPNTQNRFDMFISIFQQLHKQNCSR